MNVVIPLTQFVDVVPAPELSVATGETDGIGIATYMCLRGCVPAAADIDDDRAFDAHVFASILSIAAAQCGSIVDGSGLAAVDLEALITRWFPHASGILAGLSRPAVAPDDETLMLRDLLLAHRVRRDEDGRWLAAMIARRAMEANHLWEDLGLRNRAELSRLLSRHFAPLASRNTQNMRWKRFFYRALCESDGFVMCSTPVCTDCRDFDLCFGEESGESHLAHRRREAALQDARASAG